ncbi:GNAT family N-acetyltransferase [Nocardioides sp.]|uniref:GNAT family N-acetyltransferase n=1 Tax=Nocardioides sp. TaxID=35761 RepID=UPI0039E71DDA
MSLALPDGDPAPTVRLATSADVAAICRICETGYRFVTTGILAAATVDRIVREFYDPERVAGEVDPTGFSAHWQGYLVAELDGRVVGAAGGGLVAEDVGQLYVIYLDLDHRGQGIGSALLEAVTEQQRRLGATRQRVAVLARNRHGLPFYRARGFAEIDRRRYPPDAADGVPELVLERSL